MLKKLSLSVKYSIIFFLFLFAAAALIAYFNYSATQEQMMSQVQNAATAQANTIKEALVNMMVTNESIDDGYLRKVSSSGDITDIHILFRMDSLHFDESYLEDDARRTRLIRREVDVWDLNKNFGGEVFHTKEPVWFLICNKHLHETKQISNLSADKPKFLQSCDEMKALIPFVAEKKCTRCHNVQLGSVLGAAVMSVPLEQTARHLEANALQTLYLFAGFFVFTLVLNGFLFGRYIKRPLKKLVGITQAIGTGSAVDPSEKEGFSGDEIGKLAVAFNHMEESLDHLGHDKIKSGQLSAASNIAGSIVHDLSLPMNKVLTIAGVLKKNEPMDSEERAKKFEELFNAIRRINDMMQELVDISKGTFQLNYAPCAAEEIANTLQQDYEERLSKKNIRFAASSRSSGKLTIDKDRIRRALNNLIENAEESMPEGGVISIFFEEQNGMLKIAVEDNGRGVPDEIRSTLYEPFVSIGKSNGAGLGLTIVKKVIDLHSGTITFTSEKGKGTEFIIEIPRSPTT